MKTITSNLIPLISLLLISCGSDQKQKVTQSDEKLETVASKKEPELKDVTRKARSGLDIVKKGRAIIETVNELETQQPLQVTDFENWLPSTIQGLDKSKGGAFDINGAIGASAQYGGDYNKNIHIRIIDARGKEGAGAAGSFVSIQYDNLNKETTSGYTKTVTYDDTVVKEEYDKDQNSYFLYFFYNNTFSVQMQTKGFPQEELWNVFKEFNLDELSD